MKIRQLLFCVILASCGAESDPTATTAPEETPAETSADTDTPTAPTTATEQPAQPSIAWPSDVCPNTTLLPTDENLADRKILNSVVVGDRLSTVLPEAKALLLNADKTLYSSPRIDGCERPELYQYVAWVTRSPVMDHSFQFRFWFCAGAVAKITYCRHKGER